MPAILDRLETATRHFSREGVTADDPLDVTDLAFDDPAFAGLC